MRKEIVFSAFSAKSIDEACRQLTEYKKKVDSIGEKICDRMAERLAELMKANASEAYVDDIATNGEGMHIADIAISAPTKDGKGYMVAASGLELYFAEFGAGVRYNGSAGTSPHPMGSQLGYTIGSYGKGAGKAMRWFFEHPDGKERKNKDGVGTGKYYKMSLGTPASMPIYNAMKQVIEEYPYIAKQVAKEMGL